VRFASLFFVVLAALAQSQPEAAADARDIVRKSVERDLLNFERLKNYTYTERDEQRSYDKKGNLRKVEADTYEVLILGGRDYERLIARDDKPLPETEARKEQVRMDKEIARRQRETASEKARLEKRRQEERKFLDEVPEAFDFRVIGEESVSGKPAWVISAEPKPGYQAKERRAKLIAKMRGKIWIDQNEFQWVKIEAEAADTLSFGLGLLRIEPGATVRFEQARVNDEIWLPASANIRVDGRLALFKRIHSEVDMRFRDYKKFQADSQFVVGTASK